MSKLKGTPTISDETMLLKLSETQDYLQCEYCLRSFHLSKEHSFINCTEAFDRHVEACKNTKARPKPPPSMIKLELLKTKDSKIKIRNSVAYDTNL